MPVNRSSGKAGARGHRQHVAVARIHHDHRPGAPGHRALSHLLNAPVDRGDDLGARVGLLAPHDSHLPAEGVHLDALAAISAAQVFVEQALKPRLPDHVASPVPPVLHLLVVHLPDVAEQMSGEGTRRIHALGLDLDDHPGQLEPALPELGDLLERETAAHALGTDGVGRHPVDRLLQLGQRDLEQDGHPREDRVAILQLARNEREGEGRPIVDQRLPVSVEEDAARRRHRADADAVLVRHFLQPPALERLQIPQLCEQADKSHHGEHGHGQHPAAPAIAPTDGT